MLAKAKTAAILAELEEGIVSAISFSDKHRVRRFDISRAGERATFLSSDGARSPCSFEAANERISGAGCLEDRQRLVGSRSLR
jgi:hypothetical protein